VVYDYIDKLRQLDLTGDKEAAKELAEFEKKRVDHDVPFSLKFDRTMLDRAKKSYELISPLEHMDLTRLFKDRNRCAHPLMNSLEDTYQPPAELARYHIRNAVTHLLQHPPVQGKVALDKLIKDIASPYFPETVDGAVRRFSNGPLAHPREVLVRNFVVVLLKGLLLDDLSEHLRCSRVVSLKAVRQMHHAMVEQSISEKLSDVVRRVDNTCLVRVLQYLHAFAETWIYIQDDEHDRLVRYTLALPNADLLQGLVLSLGIEPLRSSAIERLTKVNDLELQSLIRLHRRQEFVEPAIRLYKQSRTEKEADMRGQQLLSRLVPHLTQEHVHSILQVMGVNTQIRDSRTCPDVLENIYNEELVPTGEFNRLLTEYLGEKFASNFASYKKRFDDSIDDMRDEPEDC